jgi:alpha-L-rhamnosidase
LYITSLGVFEATLNGHRVGDEHLAPGWTSYKFRLAYRIYDVSPLLLPGEKNVISVEVAEGWYAGRLGFKGGIRFRYGDELGLFAQLEIQDEDEAVLWDLLSDDSWSYTATPIINSELYDGEVYDMNHTTLDTFNTRILPKSSAQLVAPDIPPVRVTETKPCTRIFISKNGKTILDFGQNLVGKLLISSLVSEKGKSVTFRHAEVMENGELGTRPLRDAKCCDTIIGSGATLSDWSPKFTFHGFRYIEVNGWPGSAPPINDIQALVLHTDMKRRGWFECSNPYVNKLHDNVVWSMRGNFLSLPTDCPQRDERLGWTGDLQVFAPTATYLYDTLGILGNWLQDVAAEQMEEGKGGIPPLVCPLAISPNWPHMAQAVWDDVTILAPDAYSSDKGLLER